MTHQPFVSEIIENASRLSGIPVAMIKGTSRAAYLVRIRAAIIHTARSYVSARNNPTRFSYPLIARALGDRDHTTMIHAQDCFQIYCESDSAFAAFADRLQEMCDNPGLCVVLEGALVWPSEKIRAKYAPPPRTRRQIGAELRQQAARDARVRAAHAVFMRRTVKDKNDFSPSCGEEVDGAHLANASIARGSRRLLAAILRERGY